MTKDLRDEACFTEEAHAVSLSDSRFPTLALASIPTA
jgi:hypothetical protein